MDSTIIAGFLGLSGALVGSAIVIGYQYWQYRKQLALTVEAEIAAQKKRVIMEMISYRFVLVDRGNHATPTTAFNAALSVVPVLFSHNERCIEAYRALGQNFTPEKFHALVIELMKDVPLPTKDISVELLENVPARRPITGT